MFRPPPVPYKHPPEETLRLVQSQAPPTKPVKPLPRPTSREKDRCKVLDDELGKIVNLQVARLKTVGWKWLKDEVRGRGDLLTKEWVACHPAYSLIQRLEKVGAPAVMSTSPWSQRKLDRLIRRGSHKSCQEYLSFLREELLDFTQKGFWLVLPYRVVRQLQKQGHLLGLRVSPMGVVPQRNRRPRLIVDLTFNDVNADTLQFAPTEAMQFGRALERILYKIRHANPRFGPVYLSKTDLSDGFYRIGLTESATAKLAVALPKFPDEEQLLALPLVLPMGWVSSPPYFCAVTETVADLVNNWPANVHPPPHPMEEVSQTPPPEESETPPEAQPIVATPTSASPQPAAQKTVAQPHLESKTATPIRASPGAPPTKPDVAPPVLRPFVKPVIHTDCYVDDFVQALQGPPEARLRLIRRLLHSIDAVFRPVDSQDSPLRKTVPSLKKFLAGDGYLSTKKIILGWLLDTVRQTLELPPHRIERLQEIFDSLRNKDRVPVKLWHKVLGELRHMSLGVPGSRGLFSMLQEGLRHSDRHRIRITQEMRDQLSDFEYLTQSLAERPTELAEIVPDDPVAAGPHDASGLGAGGAWLPATTNSNIVPILWRAPFPDWVRALLVSFKNPRGTITNSDLELAGLLIHHDVIAQQVNLRGRTLAPLGDNIPTTTWHHKHSTTTTGPAAYLLRLNSIHQRHYRYNSYSSFIPGKANGMGDDPSRLWHLTDSQLLAHFDLHYPQQQPWQIVHPRPEMISSVLSALSKQRPELQSVLSMPPTKTACGVSGRPSLPLSKESIPTSTPSSRTSTYLFSKFSPTKFATEETRPAASLSELNVYRTTYAPLPRRCAWGPAGAQIPAMGTTSLSTSS